MTGRASKAQEASAGQLQGASGALAGHYPPLEKMLLDLSSQQHLPVPCFGLSRLTQLH
jgi:hypothetical protein